MAGEQVTLTFLGSKGKVVHQVPRDIKSLRVDYEYFSTIQGLDKLKSLETLVIGFNLDTSNYSFLSGLHLKRLVVSESNIENLRFLSSVLSLEAVYMDYCSLNDFSPVDLSNNKKLKLIEFESWWNLQNFPFKYSLPQSLQFLWLPYNKISSLDSDIIKALLKVPFVSFFYNPVVGKLNNYGLPVKFGEYKTKGDLSPDLLEFYADLWHAEFFIQGKHAP
jgi:hypothetical protein